MTIRYSSLALALIAVLMVPAMMLLPRDGAIAQEAQQQANGAWSDAHRAPLPAGLSVPAATTAKLTSDLSALHEADAGARAFGSRVTAADTTTLPGDLPARVASKGLLIDDSGRVQVFVSTSGNPDDLVPSLTALGMTVERTDGPTSIVQGRLPIAALTEAADLPDVVGVRPPERAVVNAGSVTSQGDSILGAASLRSTFGADGSNVRVGVISDGMQGLATSQASGDLPAVNTTTCNKAPTGTPTDPGAGAEGTAMSEIVHDLAPGAEIWFGYFNINVGTVLDFQAAVNCLAQNTDVVLDDIGWFNVGAYDGTSSVSLNATNALNNASNRIRGYYEAVANAALSHYQETFVDSGFTITDGGVPAPVHRWQATGATTDAGFPQPCTTGSAVSCFNTFVVPAGGSAFVDVQWNDPFGASTNDFDAFLFDSTHPAPISSSTNRQSVTHSPTESLFVTNTTGSAQAFFLLLAKFSGVAKTFDIFLNCSLGCVPTPSNTDLNYNTVSSSVPNNSDASGGVISSGAINQADPGNDTIEPFSSRGPTNDGRTKPEITAIDGVSVTGDGGFPSTFFGTSATSPHVGAIAALLLTCRPSLKSGDRAVLRNALLNSAVDLGAVGTDNTFGSGRINAPAAASAAGCLPDTDGDGCPDAKEQGPNPLQGGARDSTNPWDFFDVPIPALTATNTIGSRKRAVTIGGVIAVLFYVGTQSGGPANLNGVSYNSDLNKNGIPDGQEYDRSASTDATKPWRSGPPNGAVTIGDVIVELAQVGDNCTT